MPIHKNNKYNMQSRSRYYTKDRQIECSPIKFDKPMEKNKESTLLCILKIKFKNPNPKESNNPKKKLSARKEQSLDEASNELGKLTKVNNFEVNVKKVKNVSNSNDRDKNYMYNQFNITNQIFTMKRRIQNKDRTDFHLSLEGLRNNIKTSDKESRIICFK